MFLRSLLLLQVSYPFLINLQHPDDFSLLLFCFAFQLALEHGSVLAASIMERNVRTKAYRLFKLNSGEANVTSLHVAAAAGNCDVVDYLIVHESCRSPGVNAQNSAGLTALHLAAREGYVLVVERLLRDVRTMADCQDKGNDTAPYGADKRSGLH